MRHLHLCLVFSITAEAVVLYLFIYLFICDVYTGYPIQQRWFKRRLIVFYCFSFYGLLLFSVAQNKSGKQFGQ